MPENKVESTLTDEQIKEADAAYSLVTEIEITKSEMEEILDMFHKPERFTILRKVLMQFSNAERGLVLPRPESVIGTNPENLALYGQQVAIDSLADERIRQCMRDLYFKVKTEKVRQAEAELEKKNAEKLEKEEGKEKTEEENEDAKRKVGINV